MLMPLLWMWLDRNHAHCTPTHRCTYASTHAHSSHIDHITTTFQFPEHINIHYLICSAQPWGMGRSSSHIPFFFSQMKKLELLLKWQTIETEVKPKSLSLTNKWLKINQPEFQFFYDGISLSFLLITTKIFGQNTKDCYLRMQKSKQNQAACGGDLKPREATQLGFPGMA